MGSSHYTTISTVPAQATIRAYLDGRPPQSDIMSGFRYFRAPFRDEGFRAALSRLILWSHRLDFGLCEAALLLNISALEKAATVAGIGADFWR